MQQAASLPIVFHWDPLQRRKLMVIHYLFRLHSWGLCQNLGLVSLLTFHNENEGDIVSTVLGSKFSPDGLYFPIYSGLKNIVSPNSSILRHDGKELLIHKIPKSVLIRIAHFYPFGVFCSFLKAYTSKMIRITPHWEALFSPASFLFLFTSQSAYL